MTVSAVSAVWTDLRRDVQKEIDAWYDLDKDLSVRRMETHTFVDAIHSELISADDRAAADNFFA